MRKFWSSVHFLRAVAALLVVVHHIPKYLQDHGFPSFPEFEAGAFGVDIFFAISGFVMYSTTSATNTSAQKFLRDRAIRILPLYWLITILLGISALVIPSLFNNFEVHPTQIVESLLFIPFYNEDGNIRPILSMGWTLHYEVAFYLVTACCIAVNINKQNKALTAAVFITLLSIAISSFNAELKFSFLQLVAPLSIEFLFGATTAFIFTRYGQLISEGKSRILFALGCLGISSALLATNNEAEIGIGFPRLMHWGIPGALILISGLLLEPEIKKIVDKTKTISLLADASYSIYLIHGISFSVTYKIAYFVGIRNDAVLAAALLMGAIIVGTITHKRVEKPLQIWIATHIKK